MKILWLNPDDSICEYDKELHRPFKFLFWNTDDGGLIVTAPVGSDHEELSFMFKEFIPDRDPEGAGTCEIDDEDFPEMFVRSWESYKLSIKTSPEIISKIKGVFP